MCGEGEGLIKELFMENNNTQSELKKLTRMRMGLIWKSYKESLSAGLNAEDRKLAEIMNEHPEYYHAWEFANEYADGEITEGQVNPFMHISMHQVVENQLFLKDPSEVTDFYNEQLAKGISRHDIIHKIAAALSNEMFEMLKTGRMFDKGKYLNELKKLE